MEQNDERIIFFRQSDHAYIAHCGHVISRRSVSHDSAVIDWFLTDIKRAFEIMKILCFSGCEIWRIDLRFGQRFQILEMR